MASLLCLCVCVWMAETTQWVILCVRHRNQRNGPPPPSYIHCVVILALSFFGSFHLSMRPCLLGCSRAATLGAHLLVYVCFVVTRGLSGRGSLRHENKSRPKLLLCLSPGRHSPQNLNRCHINSKTQAWLLLLSFFFFSFFVFFFLPFLWRGMDPHVRQNPCRRKTYMCLRLS